MFKINNKSVLYSSGILAIFAFGIIAVLPVIVKAGAHADYYPAAPYAFYTNNQNQVNTNNSNFFGTSADSNNNYSNNSDQNNNKDENFNGLVANALFGSNSVLPSGIMQWVLFGIVILLIVILVRRISGGAEKYHSEPLKHA